MSDKLNTGNTKFNFQEFISGAKLGTCESVTKSSAMAGDILFNPDKTRGMVMEVINMSKRKLPIGHEAI